jgi:hyperosmotically inducible protein
MIIKILSRLEAVGLAAILIAIAGCSTPDRTSGQVYNDRRTASRVKKELGKAPIFKYPDVGVNAYDGNVQLTGYCETEEQRLAAAHVAAGVKGVNQVINQIMIKPTPAGRTTIRDPLGQESGRLLLDTNIPPLKLPSVEPVPNPTPTPNP